MTVHVIAYDTAHPGDVSDFSRNLRTTMKSSHIDMDKHIRAATSGIVGSILGSARVFISANTVHQAPPGGGLCACIVRNDV